MTEKSKVWRSGFVKEEEEETVWLVDEDDWEEAEEDEVGVSLLVLPQEARPKAMARQAKERRILFVFICCFLLVIQKFVNRLSNLIFARLNAKVLENRLSDGSKGFPFFKHSSITIGR